MAGYVAANSFAERRRKRAPYPCDSRSSSRSPDLFHSSERRIGETLGNCGMADAKIYRHEAPPLPSSEIRPAFRSRADGARTRRRRARFRASAPLAGDVSWLIVEN